MGAKQRAQKRDKAVKGSQKGAPFSQRKLNSSMLVPDLNPLARSNALMGWQDFSDSPSPPTRKAFSMGDVARHTDRHASGWGSSKLRDLGISFVGAGTLHQDPEHIKAFAHERDAVGHIQEDNKEPDADVPRVKVEASSDTSIRFVPAMNQEEDMMHQTSEPKMGFSKPRQASVSSSSSSEAEQIVFTGRSKVAIHNANSLQTSKKNSRSHSPAVHLPSRKHIGATSTPPILISTKPLLTAKTLNEQPLMEASSSDRRVTNSRLRRKGRTGRRQSDIDEQEAIMRDYIANMAMEDSQESDSQVQQLQSLQTGHVAKSRQNETVRYYNGDGEENMKVRIRSNKKMPVRNLDQVMDWNSDDLQDFDDLSTSDEDVVEISQVLRYRERSNRMQYLVTPNGLGTSDAKWIPHEKLTSVSAQKEITIFKEIQAMEFEESFEDDDDEDDNDNDDEEDNETTDEEVEEALNDLIDYIESEDDENTRIMKRTARMTDEQIARALAKQEELGMGGDELLLFSGDIDEEEDQVAHMDDDFQRNDNFVAFSLKQHTSNRSRSKRNKKERDSFPSAAAFADALDQDPYGAFDVMDFDRPSLRPKTKGRKSGFPYDLELEDEELREQLISTWTKDRDKKAQRKQDKEEARMAELLEYADRSHPAAIKAEIRRFLLQEVDTLRLSPMESATRASIHRLAKALKLNSRSEGKDGTAKGRYPVLTKTVRTPRYTIDTVWEIDALLNTRKFFPKNPNSYKKDKLPRGANGTMKMQRSGGVSGASYMNGEIVGASAPEIGAENKGRAMLEKMGWTSGMAIGAEGNKGSLEAVKHVFKTSRAGLG